MSKRKNVYVFLNEHHELYPEQREILHKKFGDSFVIVPIPVKGLTLAEMDHMIDRKVRGYPNSTTCVFVSPVPYLIMELSRMQGEGHPVEVCIMHTDKRKQFVSGSGRQVSTATETGWKIV